MRSCTKIEIVGRAPAYAGEEEREGELVWEPYPGYVLGAADRVVLAATRRGLGALIGRRPHHGEAGARQV